MPTILVVEDDMDELKAMKRGAEEAIIGLGGVVETASDPDAAIQLLKKK